MDYHSDHEPCGGSRTLPCGAAVKTAVAVRSIRTTLVRLAGGELVPRPGSFAKSVGVRIHDDESHRATRPAGGRQLLFALASCATALGCTAPIASGSIVQNTGRAEVAPSDATTAACPVDGGLAGATYDITKSKFAFGSTPRRDGVGGGFVRWVGSDGALGISTSGAELGVMNAGAPESSLPDWSSDPAASAAHVLAYFESMGVEACQVPGSGATYFGSGTGTADGGLTAFTSNGSTTELERGYSGIRIKESLAYAHVESADQTTGESLYWPAIPADVVSAAIAFRAALATPVGLAAYKALLPPDAQGDGQVVIHHSSGESQGAFAAGVTYDVLSIVPADAGQAGGDSGGLIEIEPEPLSFDSSGNPVSTAW